MNKRRYGILLHITSLPSPHGIRDFGDTACKIVDFLAETRQCLWQILPLNPTCTVYGNSPYSSYSAFAGNHIMISPDLLVQDGILSKSDIKGHVTFPHDRVDYKTVTAYKESILRTAYKISISSWRKTLNSKGFVTKTNTGSRIMPCL